MPIVFQQIATTEELSALCRLCATQCDSRSMTQIFIDSLDSLEIRIARVTPVQLCCGDGLPSSVCKLCVKKLDDTTQFIAEAIATYESLHKVLTFIAKASSLDEHEHGFTEKTLVLFEVMTGKCDLSSICRLCATQHEPLDMSKIFVGVCNPYENKIRSVLHTKMSEGDGLPDSLCGDCVGMLDAAHNFIMVSFASDNFLRNVLYKGIEVEKVIKQETNFDLGDPVLEESSKMEGPCEATSPIQAEQAMKTEASNATMTDSTTAESSNRDYAGEFDMNASPCEDPLAIPLKEEMPGDLLTWLEVDKKPTELHAMIQQDIMPLELQQDIKPTELQEDIKPTELQEDLKPWELLEDIKPSELQQDIKPTELQRDIKPAKLQQDIKPTELLQDIKPAELQTWHQQLETSNGIRMRCHQDYGSSSKELGLVWGTCVHAAELFTCASCATEFHTKKALRQHFIGSEHHRFCSKTFLQNQPTVKLVRLVKTENINRRVKTEQDEKHAEFRAELQQSRMSSELHTRLHPNETSKEIQTSVNQNKMLTALWKASFTPYAKLCTCNYCAEEFPTKKELSQHLIGFENLRFCSKTFQQIQPVVKLIRLEDNMGITMQKHLKNLNVSNQKCVTLDCLLKNENKSDESSALVDSNFISKGIGSQSMQPVKRKNFMCCKDAVQKSSIIQKHLAAMKLQKHNINCNLSDEKYLIRNNMHSCLKASQFSDESIRNVGAQQQQCW